MVPADGDVQVGTKLDIAGLFRTVGLDSMLLWILANYFESHSHPVCRDICFLVLFSSILGIFLFKLHGPFKRPVLLASIWIVGSCAIAAGMFPQIGYPMPTLVTGKWRMLLPSIFTTITAYSWYLAFRPPSQTTTVSAPTSAKAATTSPIPQSDKDSRAGTQPILFKKRFRILRQRAVINMGLNGFAFTLDAGGDCPPFASPMSTPNGPPITFLVKNWVIYFNATVSDGVHSTKLHEGDPDILPVGWDMNQDERAMEIVNENQSAIFRVQYTSDLEINLSGIFSPRPDCFAYYEEGGASNGDVKRDDVLRIRFAPIFKYPSLQHPSERINPAEPISYPRPIGIANTGRSFQALRDGVGPWPSGTIFSEYDLRCYHPAPGPNPNDDKYYEVLVKQLEDEGSIRRVPPISIPVARPAATQPTTTKSSARAHFDHTREAFSQFQENHDQRMRRERQTTAANQNSAPIQTTSQPAFFVTSTARNASPLPTPMWFVDELEFDNRLKRRIMVSGAMLIEFTNLKVVPIMIAAYVVGLQSANGIWTAAQIMHNGRMFHGKEPTQVREVIYQAFDTVIQRNIGSHETVRGWIIFKKFPEGKLRLEIRDAFGNVFVESFQPSIQKDFSAIGADSSPTQPMLMSMSKNVQDITRFPHVL
jgi:hypothetical protein